MCPVKNKSFGCVDLPHTVPQLPHSSPTLSSGYEGNISCVGVTHVPRGATRFEGRPSSSSLRSTIQAFDGRSYRGQTAFRPVGGRGSALRRGVGVSRAAPYRPNDETQRRTRAVSDSGHTEYTQRPCVTLQYTNILVYHVGPYYVDLRPVNSLITASARTECAESTSVWLLFHAYAQDRTVRQELGLE